MALCVWAVVGAARCIGGRTAGSRAGLVFLTCPLTVAMAGAVMTDPYLGLGVALSLFGVVRWMTAPPDSGRARAGTLLLVPLGLTIGFLSKGPVALLPLACAALATLGSAEGRAVLRRFPFGRVLGLTLLMSAPWFVLAEWSHPGYARYFFLGEHFERYLNARWTGDRYGGTHPRPPGTIWLLLLVGALPWMRQIWRLVGRGSRERRAATGLPRPVLHTLMGAAFGPLVIFTFAGSVLPTYPFPALIGLAILLGVGAQDAVGVSPPRRPLAEPRLVFLATACVAATVLVVSLLPPAALVRGTQRDVVRDTAGKQLLYGARHPLPLLRVLLLGRASNGGQVPGSQHLAARARGAPSLVDSGAGRGLWTDPPRCEVPPAVPTPRGSSVLRVFGHSCARELLRRPIIAHRDSSPGAWEYSTMKQLILGAMIVPLLLGLARAKEEQRADPLDGLAQIGKPFEATAKTLVARGDKAVPVLRDALQDWRPQVRQNAAVVAGRLGKDAWPLLGAARRGPLG